RAAPSRRSTAGTTRRRRRHLPRRLAHPPSSNANRSNRAGAILAGGLICGSSLVAWRKTMLVQGRRHVAASLAGLIGGLVAAQFMAAPAKAADPIKVGWVGPLSPPGGYAEGALMKQAAELAAEEINAKGGVLGRPIQVIFQDTRGQPEEGTAAAERLI